VAKNHHRQLFVSERADTACGLATQLMLARENSEIRKTLGRCVAAGGLEGRAAMLDFRFLIGAILAGVGLVMIGLRAFGPVDPLIATIADRPNLETEAAPRQVHSRGLIPASNAMPVPIPGRMPAIAVSTKPAGTQIAIASEPALRPVSAEKAGSNAPVSTPLVPEVTGSVDPVAVQTEETAPPAKSKRRAATRKKENEDLNPVLLFFSENAKVK